MISVSEIYHPEIASGAGEIEGLPNPTSPITGSVAKRTNTTLKDHLS
jgi:hypothetical protein